MDIKHYAGGPNRALRESEYEWSAAAKAAHTKLSLLVFDEAKLRAKLDLGPPAPLDPEEPQEIDLTAAELRVEGASHELIECMRRSAYASAVRTLIEDNQ